MAATAVPLNALASIDPATGETLAYVESTPTSTLSDTMRRARAAQAAWANVPTATRCGRNISSGAMEDAV